MEKFKVFSTNLQREVDICIRRPIINSDAKPNIIYFHDGQNAFVDHEASFGHSWKLADCLDELETSGLISPTYVIAISSNNLHQGMERCREYSIFDNDFLIKRTDSRELDAVYTDYILHAKGNQYLQFISEELMPDVEAKIGKTFDRKERMMIGSSMGGMITHTCGLLYPELFSKLICISNAYWYCFDQFAEFLKNQKPDLDQQYYLDIGTDEDSMRLDNMPDIYVDTNVQIAEIMKANQFNCEFQIIEDAKHNEAAWSVRIAEILTKYLD